MKNFVLIGAGGYIAPRHMQAIKETGNNLLAAIDKHDSVGILDRYFPGADFFTEFERFDRHCEKLKRNGITIDYVSVCSPNYLHDAHVRFGLRLGADVICEKPLVLNPWNVDALADMENETGKKIYTILQLRLHSAIIALRKKIMNDTTTGKHRVDLKYITPRGNWYQSSWKGDIDKSGGIATNIGIHFFDLLLWLFGDTKDSSVHQHDSKTASGKLFFNNAEADWLLSIDAGQLPGDKINAGQSALRSLTINGEEIIFNDGFTDLHTESYKEVLAGNGIRLSEVKKVTELLFTIRNAGK